MPLEDVADEPARQIYLSCVSKADLKKLLKKILLGADAIPQWAAVGLRDPQQQVRVRLSGLPGITEPLDVTRNNVVAALRPFTIGICLASGLTADSIVKQASPLLEIQERQPNDKILGRIQLRFAKAIDLPNSQQDRRLCLFETSKHSNYCLSGPRLQMYYLDEWRRSRKQQSPYNFKMRPAELHSLLVFYICPRPVVLVTVMCADASNVFPMDLIGPTDSPYFLMALRLTSPAVRLMQESRRMAVSSVPAEFKSIAYDLGKHHHSQRIDMSALPFDTVLSSKFALPVPRAALRVREVEVQATHEVGSHMLFVTTVVREDVFSDGLQMFHVPGLFQSYRTRQGRALPSA